MKASALAILLALAGSASADKADALFKKAKKLLAEKRYPEACATFEQVDKTDPGIGAKLNVGKCYEEWGKLALAFHWYTDAQKMAADTKDDRAPKIQALADELDTNVPRVTIKLPEGADPAVIATLTFDGKPVDRSQIGIEQRVDPGPHAIEYIVDGKKKKKMVPVERGGSSEVQLEVPKGKGDGWKLKDPKKDPNAKDPNAKDPVTDPVVETPAAPGHGQRVAGISVAVGGAVMVGIAGVVTLAERSKYKNAIDSHCMGSPSMCDASGLDTTHDARHKANIATVISIVGGAAVIGGVVLYLTAPKAGHPDEHALYLAPAVGADGGAVVFGGRY